jgi:hypothetical protein
VQQAGSYLGYSGGDPDDLVEAAHDPELTFIQKIS